jgi:hypothetical protein
MLNMAPEEMRLPMTPLAKGRRTTLKKTLEEYGLLS